MDDSFDFLEKCTVFSALDDSSGYWKLEIEYMVKHITAFAFHHGLYRYIRMQFKFKNAPSTLHWAIDEILATASMPISLVYLDDMKVFLKTPEKHTIHEKQVLTLLWKALKTFRIMRCCFFAITIEYLGHIIRHRRVEIAFHTTDMIRQLKEPSNEILPLLIRICNVFAHITHKFARIAIFSKRKLQLGEPQDLKPLNNGELNAMITVHKIDLANHNRNT